MNNQQLIEIIAKDKSYLPLCQRIVKRSYSRDCIAEDLYQETMLAVCSVQDNRLINAYNDGYLQVFVVGIINNIWNKRKAIKYHIDGSTSPLFDYSSTIESDWSFHDKDNNKLNLFDRRFISDISLDYNPDIDMLFTATKKIIKADCNSEKMCIRYKARVYNHSNNNIANLDCTESFNNSRQFAKYIGINYPAIRKTCNQYLKILTDKLTKLKND